MNRSDPDINLVQIIMDRMDEHREQSGARHQALCDNQRVTNQKLEQIVVELSGGNVRFERVEATIKALDVRVADLEGAQQAVKNNVMEIIKAVVVPALLSGLSAAAGAFAVIKNLGH